MKQGRLFYFIGIIVLVFGIATFSYCAASFIIIFSALPQEIIGPGKEAIVLKEKGTYSIFYEKKSIIDGKPLISGSSNISGIKCMITNKGNGNKIPVKPDTSSTFSYGDRQGVSILAFDINEPGTYEFLVTNDGNEPGAKFVLALEHEFAKKIIKKSLLLVTGIAVLSASVTGSIVMFILGYIKRKEARENAQMRKAAY